jgi:NAD(P)H-dependent flavin oxidoreductase YrpB (nitropropane dioxygenase family)
MTIWPDHRILDLLGIELPIILAPMAGSGTAALAIAVAEAGGLGSLACALLSPDQARVEFAVIRQGTSRPINMNFFCHAIPTIDAAREDAWRQRLRPYFVELGLINRIAGELGPMAENAPPFPLAGAALAPLRAKSEAAGSDDFTPLWSGQAARLGRELPARELTALLAEEALATRNGRFTERGRQ